MAAKRYLIFDADGVARLALDWRHDRSQVIGILRAQMNVGDVAVEVSPSGNTSLETLLGSVHRCRATLRNGNIEDVTFYQADGQGQITSRTRLLQPDQLIAVMARDQYTRVASGLTRHSRKQLP